MWSPGPGVQCGRPAGLSQSAWVRCRGPVVGRVEAKCIPGRRLARPKSSTMEGRHMTDMTRQYSAAASRARNAVDKTAGFWTRSTGTMMDLLPPMPQVDLVLAIESYFSLMQRTVEI